MDARSHTMPASHAQDPSAVTAPFAPRARGDILLAFAALAIGAFYVWTVAPSRSDWGNIDARGAYYNLLVDGFSAGQLNLKVDVPAGLAALPDPYDPQANHVYRTQHHLHDTSYYGGKLHIYYGITPALVVFGPYHWLTGGYLFNKQAIAVFAALGYLASLLLLRSMWRRYFPSVSRWTVAGCALALGLTNSVPALLRIPGICEVAIACAYAFAMLACVAVWQALHDQRRPVLWLMLGSLSYGLAVGARPSMLFGAVILLVPVAVAWVRHNNKDTPPSRARLLAAALGPLFLVGGALALYNHARFGDIFEFGQRYQLAGDRQDNARHFSFAYLWFNFRLYFLQFAPWTSIFPFVQDIALPPAPTGHAVVESAQGIFSNTPFAVCAFASVLAFRPSTSATLRWFLVGIIALFLTSAFVLCLFYGTVLRYQVEFHPTLVLLACFSVLVLESRAAASSNSAGGGAAGSRPVWVRVARALGISALGFSVGFSVLNSVKMLAEELNKQGVQLAQQGKTADAIARLEAALRIKRDLVPAHNNLGTLQLDAGNAPRAVEHFTAAANFDPRSLEAVNGLGRALVTTGQLAEAAEAFRHAVALRADVPVAHVNLAIVLQHLGRHSEAVTHFEAALALGYDAPGLRAALAASRAAHEQSLRSGARQ